MRLVPDRIFDRISDITVDVLSREGIRGLVLDIDYTLAPRDVALPDRTIVEFIRSLREAGIRLYILSNNHHNRVSKFAAELGLPFTCNGMKPFPASFRRAVREMGLAPREAAAVGDQIYTDVFGAHAAGLRAWLVAPAGQGKSAFYRFRRRLEQPFIRRYFKSAGK